MMFAYVMLQTEYESQTRVLEEVCRIEQVSEHYEIYGLYDILLKVQCRDNVELEQVIYPLLEKTPMIKSAKLLRIKR
jgi:DNA-binding Lrp family transcriptional regulator